MGNPRKFPSLQRDYERQLWQDVLTQFQTRNANYRTAKQSRDRAIRAFLDRQDRKAQRQQSRQLRSKNPASELALTFNQITPGSSFACAYNRVDMQFTGRFLGYPEVKSFPQTFPPAGLFVRVAVTNGGNEWLNLALWGVIPKANGNWAANYLVRPKNRRLIRSHAIGSRAASPKTIAPPASP